MAIVTGGLGQPESPLVSGGLGASDDGGVIVGNMSANAYGVATCYGTLTATTEAPAQIAGGGGGRVRRKREKADRVKWEWGYPGLMEAKASGRATAYGTLTGEYVAPAKPKRVRKPKAAVIVGEMAARASGTSVARGELSGSAEGAAVARTGSASFGALEGVAEAQGAARGATIATARAEGIAEGTAASTGESAAVGTLSGAAEAWGSSAGRSSTSATARGVGEMTARASGSSSCTGRLTGVAVKPVRADDLTEDELIEVAVMVVAILQRNAA